MKLQKITSSLVRSLILPRKKDSHKGDYGHVLVVAGSRNMPGAAVLCANAALRTGAGLVTTAVIRSIKGEVSKKIRPESMILPLSENGRGTFNAAASGKILEFIRKRKVTAVALGPGLGRNRDISLLVNKILSVAGITVVLDADGLNALETAGLKKARCRVIATPHPGEMSRLTGLEKNEIQRSRAKAAKEFALKTGIVCVLKGSGTIVSDGKRVFVNTTGNPGMAKGGSGDVLTGVIAALLAQVKGARTLDAALAGVYIHGLAGDIAAKTKTAPGMLPGDISESLPGAFKKAGL